MKYYLGVDLGSTTTKAVLIDGHEDIIGRGLTNTRCNYSVATDIARAEALNNARFYLIEREVRSMLGEQELPKDLLEELDGFFRMEQQYAQLEHLRTTCIETAEEGLRPTVELLFEKMEGEANDLFQAVRSDRSRFFRDLAGSRYYALSEKLAEAALKGEATLAGSKHVSFDALAAVYDKAILLVENQTLNLDFGTAAMKALNVLEQESRSGGSDLALNSEMLKAFECAIKVISNRQIEIAESVGTGYGRQRLPFKKHQIRSEILCHGLGAHFMFPNTRTVLDIGGQDTKAIQIDGNGVVTNFQMNDRCAAGCGRYLGYIADELNLGLHELGPLSLQADRTCQICSTCTVFAGTELRSLLSLGEQRENILSGLHRAIVLRALSLLARSGGVQDELTFTGGVAKNQAVVDALSSLVSESYGERSINIHTDSIYTGAIGAALYAHRAIDLEEIDLEEAEGLEEKQIA